MNQKLIEKLEQTHSLSLQEYEHLLENRTSRDAALLAEKAVQLRKLHYGTDIFIRGLIEFTNYCKNDCLYCGIRKSNTTALRYRLDEEQILSCCRKGYDLGFRTFVLQGGEDPFFQDDRLCSLVEKIKAQHPDCAVTLSVGERTRESYQRLFDAGADRYLLRHETADSAHYQKLHPKEMSWAHRMECLQILKETGFQVGCGFMVGSPRQTIQSLAKDLKFIEGFRPDMCGIGPFIPHSATPLAGAPAGTLELTCFLLSVIRLIRPNILLPATTALGSIHPAGQEKGILSGANVVMPNLSPVSVREKYSLYNNKLSTGVESAQGLEELSERMRSIGYRVVTDRGDIRK